MKKSKIQALTCTLGFLLITGITGCSDSNEEKQKTKEVSTKTAEAPKIEVVQNKDAHAIKVAVKKNDNNLSKSYYYDYNVKSAYDENSRPANKDASVRVKPRTNVDANMNIRSPYDKVQVSMLVKKLSKEFIVKCSACHNDYANGVIGPSLLGKDSSYIYNKIMSFKTGEKSNPLMNDLVKMMDEAKIKKLSQEIYEFNKEINQMRKK
jgi:cytochrome c553